MTTEKMRVAYDQIAAQFATINAVMPPELSTAIDRFVRLAGSGARVLDLGCGAGRDMAWFEKRQMNVTGVDLSAGMLAQAKPQVQGELAQMDMRNLAFRSGRFDGVWCNASLLHLPKREAPGALAEMRRVLAPRGVLFLSLQQGAEEVWERYPYDDAIERWFARYKLAEVKPLLANNGFTLGEHGSNQTGSRRWLHFLATPTEP